MKLRRDPTKWLKKKAKTGFRGYPVGTIAFYGPDNLRASKAAVGIIEGAEEEAKHLRRWFSDNDVRDDPTIAAEIVDFLRQHNAHSVAMTDRIIGCPHEEGIDYPEGGTCPQCPFWVGRDRWAGG